MKLWQEMRAYMTAMGWMGGAPDEYLLAVSGGLDSCVMTALFAEAGLRFSIAHCNFQLRGAQSEEDEQFVRELAADCGCHFYTRRFDTLQQAERSGVSVQMAARRLRYDWLEEIRVQTGARYIAAAHHLNDSAETLLLHLAKGCGLRGLHGIPPQSGAVIRPLLFASRSRLRQYQQQQELDYREDASNQEVKYQRNFLRHRVWPALQSLNPNLEATMAANLQRFQETEYLFDEMLRRISEEALQERGGQLRLSIPVLMDHRPALATLLYEFLGQRCGLSSAQAGHMAQALQGEQVGQWFYTPTHRILLDRAAIIAEPYPTAAHPRSYEIAEGAIGLKLPEGRLELHYLDASEVVFSQDPKRAVLCAGKLQFPLRLRRWQPGDRFQPLGMGGQHQKLQDFFSNQKFSRLDKERAWVLEDRSGRIAWLVGHRISHEFRWTGDCRAAWVLKYHPQS